MTHQLEQEFNLPIQVIREIGEARRIDDLHANSFGSYKAPTESPISKVSVYKKYDLTFDEGESIGWAWICEGIS